MDETLRPPYCWMKAENGLLWTTAVGTLDLQVFAITTRVLTSIMRLDRAAPHHPIGTKSSASEAEFTPAG
jgi:hypothetical protein